MWLSAFSVFIMTDLKEQRIYFKVCFICKENCMESALSASNSFQRHCTGRTDFFDRLSQFKHVQALV